jgi:hypothetical protein
MGHHRCLAIIDFDIVKQNRKTHIQRKSYRFYLGEMKFPPNFMDRELFQQLTMEVMAPVYSDFEVKSRKYSFYL